MKGSLVMKSSIIGFWLRRNNMPSKKNLKLSPNPTQHLKTKRPNGALCFLNMKQYYPSFLIAAERRDFLRLAVFFLITPRFAALSSAWYAALSSARASAAFFSEMSFPTALTASCIVRLRRRLNTRFLREARSAFVAELVFAIAWQLYPKGAQAAMSTYRRRPCAV